MFLKSIRWRLQMWYGIILIGVLAGFGVTAYELQRGKQFRRIDEELTRRVGELASALRLPARREPGLPSGPPDERDLNLRPELGLPPPGPDFPPPDRSFEADGRRPPSEFRLRPQQAALFDETDTNGFY